ncbi:hypothetical protein [Gordonia sp. CPCC 205333]|uniref:hypothetical protein n=1 Tax=Gordonia sp. CPCC 205333 TaxID=3140790 RepID=UPI003AF380AB
MRTLHFSPSSCSRQPQSGSARTALAEHVGHLLPRGIAQEAANMDWNGFTSTFAPEGAIRLGSWATEPAARDQIDCRATLSIDNRILSLHAKASGPIGAMTSMLHDIGAPIQIVSLHQRTSGDQVITFLLCENDDRQCWAAGFGASSDEASINALIAGANRLLPAAPL